MDDLKNANLRCMSSRCTGMVASSSSSLLTAGHV